MIRAILIEPRGNALPAHLEDVAPRARENKAGTNTIQLVTGPNPGEELCYACPLHDCMPYSQLCSMRKAGLVDEKGRYSKSRGKAWEKRRRAS